MKIAIVGCGWLGLPLAEELLKDGHTIFGSTTSDQKLHQLVTLGINSFIYNENTHQFDDSTLNSDLLIINFPPGKSKDYPLQIEKLINQFPDSCKIIFTSSTSIYENVNAEVNESSELNKESIMYLAEQKILRSHKKSTILRLAGLIGPNRHPVKYLSGKKVSDGNIRVNLVHLYDVVGSIKTIIEKNTWGEIYNICAPEHPKKSTYYSNAAIKMKLACPIFEFSEKTGKNVSSNKFERELNFQFVNSIYKHENQ